MQCQCSGPIWETLGNAQRQWTWYELPSASSLQRMKLTRNRKTKFFVFQNQQSWQFIFQKAIFWSNGGVWRFLRSFKRWDITFFFIALSDTTTTDMIAGLKYCWKEENEDDSIVWSHGNRTVAFKKKTILYKKCSIKKDYILAEDQRRFYRVLSKQQNNYYLHVLRSSAVKNWVKLEL